MEKWIIRIAALFCASGSAGLLWIFGVFVIIPWHTGRMLALSSGELQVLGASLLIGLAVGWVSLHLIALSEKKANPRVYAAIRALLIFSLLAAATSGMMWTPPTDQMKASHRPEAAKP